METSHEVMDQFKNLHQATSMLLYIDKFEELMGLLLQRNPYLQEGYFVSCFIAGLKDYIKTPVKAHDPRTLVQAYTYARNFVNSLGGKRSNGEFNRYSFRPTYSSPAKPSWQPAKKEVVEKTQPVQTWVAPKSVLDSSKCFKCQEPWVAGHNRVCKFRNTMHLITVDDSDSEEFVDAMANPRQDQDTSEVDNSPELQISMYALNGTLKTGKTFPLFLKLGDVVAVVLVDSGSTTTFVDPKIAAKAEGEGA